MIDPITVSQVNKNTNVATSAIETTIGKSNSTDTTTVFGKLNQILSGSGSSGGDTQAFKNLIQRTGTEFKPPSGVTKIGSNCCAGYTNLTTVSLPESITSIQDKAFTGCANLTNIKLPSNVTSLGTEVFDKCTNLNTVENFENTGITIIPSSCFRDCLSLTNIALSNLITKIGMYAFLDCHSLVLGSLPDSITIIESDAFNNCKQLNIDTIDLVNITNIGSYAFYNCSNVKVSLISGDINYIGTRAFWNTSAYEGALNFNASNRLKIGGYAFANINNVSYIQFYGEVPTSIATTAFSNCNALTEIYVNWAEGEVAGAPWGATNAVITYTG